MFRTLKQGMLCHLANRRIEQNAEPVGYHEIGWASVHPLDR